MKLLLDDSHLIWSTWSVSYYKESPKKQALVRLLWGITGSKGSVNTLRLRQNGRHLADNDFKCNFSNKIFVFQMKFHWHVLLRIQQSSFINYFPLVVSSSNNISAHKSEQPTAGCIAISHKYCCYIKHGGIITNLKFLGVCYWYVKMPQCRCVEHGLQYITFYVQKHIAPLAVCSGPPPGSRWVARGVRIYETRLCEHWFRKWLVTSEIYIGVSEWAKYNNFHTRNALQNVCNMAPICLNYNIACWTVFRNQFISSYICIVYHFSILWCHR